MDQDDNVPEEALRVVRDAFFAAQELEEDWVDNAALDPTGPFDD